MNKLRNVKYVSITPPGAILDNTSPTTAEIDTLGFSHLTIVCQVGATDIAMTALKVTESNTSGSGHADVSGLVFGTSTDIDGNASALPSATDDNGFFVFQIDLRGRKRYIDLTATMGDGTAGGYFSAMGLLSRGASSPTTETTMNAQVLAV